MFIETVGQGPALVLIHGWAMHSGIFQALRPALARRATLYLVDLPGHGRSAERDGRLQLAETARRIAQATPPAAWLGWSLGGLFCLEAARSQPDQVRALALIAANPRFVAGNDWPHGVAHAVFEQFGAELAGDYRRTVERFLALECHGSDCERQELRELRRHVFEFGEPALHVLEDGLALLADTDLRADLAGLGLPALWLAGGRDRLVPAAALEWAAAAMPAGRCRVIPGGGHAPFIGHPDAVLAELEPFLAGLAP
jgi:pimeloyl-[acyl-carrier protein] methyl ester esterase